jgi:hypothetical protein
MLKRVLALLAGVITVAAPCTLPMLLGVSIGQTGNVRPAMIALGFIMSFSAAALLLGAITRVFDFLSQESRLRCRHDWYRAGLEWQRNIATLGSGGTMPVFPLACVARMPAVDAFVIVILIGLIFRSVASQMAAAGLGPSHLPKPAFETLS